MSKALYYYGEYIQLQNDVEKEKGEEGDYHSRYGEDRMKSKAGEIKKILNKFQSGKLDGWY